MSYFNKFLLLILLYSSTVGFAQLTATGNQIYCPLSEIPIVEDFQIVDVSNNTIQALYIQISSGYNNGQDKLIFKNPSLHPNISAGSFNISEGKLTLTWTGSGSSNYSDLMSAIKDVFFFSNSTNMSGTKTFSITIDSISYLASTDHYYEYFSSPGIAWTDAMIAATTHSYYGRQGYLATITSYEEAVLVGKQSPGAGWIGGSDAETEGVWKWMTGPEVGKTFWFGIADGTTVGTDIPFAFWNTGEPNQYLGTNEDYAHITASGVGIPGSWNDLVNGGDPDPSNPYYPRGYIVEYGMPNDPHLNTSVTTKITIPTITNVTGVSSCGPSSVTLSATASIGDVIWFNSETSNTILYTGEDFTTPTLNTSTTYYVLASVNGCLTGKRTPIIATINQIPTITSTTANSVCEGGSKVLSAITTAGEINWYETKVGGTSIATGTSFETPFLTNSTTYYVDATANGCITLNRTPIQFNVFNNPFPITVDLNLDDLTILDDSTNNSIFFNNLSSSFKIENYEYAIDDSNENYKSVLFFDKLTPGVHTLFIRDRSNCGTAQLEVPILGFPKFMTPNNDGINDLWKLNDELSRYYKSSIVYVFDRFGKLIATVDILKNGWNGYYKGKLLPASDYWYKAQLTDLKGNTILKTGHFSLIN